MFPLDVQQIILQQLVRRRMAQPVERLGFKLAHALAGDANLLADFFERMRFTVQQTVTQLQNMRFAFGQARQHLFQMFAQQVLGHDLGRLRDWTCLR